MSETFVESSRLAWSHQQSGPPTVVQIACGALQRIADATEKMAASHDALQKRVEHWKWRAENAEAALATERRRTAALRGAAKKAKAAP